MFQNLLICFTFLFCLCLFLIQNHFMYLLIRILQVLNLLPLPILHASFKVSSEILWKDIYYGLSNWNRHLHYAYTFPLSSLSTYYTQSKILPLIFYLSCHNQLLHFSFDGQFWHGLEIFLFYSTKLQVNLISTSHQLNSIILSCWNLRRWGWHNLPSCNFTLLSYQAWTTKCRHFSYLCPSNGFQSNIQNQNCS